MCSSAGGEGDWPTVPGRAGNLQKAGAHPAPQPNPCPPSQVAAPPDSPVFPYPRVGLTEATMDSYEMLGTPALAF